MLNEAPNGSTEQPTHRPQLSATDEVLIDIVKHLRWTPKDQRDRALTYLRDNALAYDGSERYTVLLNVQAFIKNAATLPQPDHDWSLNTHLSDLAHRFRIHPAYLISAAQRGHTETPLN